MGVRERGREGREREIDRTNRSNSKEYGSAWRNKVRLTPVVQGIMPLKELGAVMI